MSDQLRTKASACLAAFRIMKAEYGEDIDPTIADMALIAEAYLKEHPEDEDELVTEEWLRSIGFADDAYASLSIRSHWYGHDTQHLRHTVAAVDHKGLWRANGLGCADCKTRGQVRRLASALGIDLKEND